MQIYIVLCYKLYLIHYIVNAIYILLLQHIVDAVFSLSLYVLLFNPWSHVGQIKYDIFAQDCDSQQFVYLFFEHLCFIIIIYTILYIIFYNIYIYYICPQSEILIFFVGTPVLELYFSICLRICNP